MINPFDTDQVGLVNITSGVELQKDSAKSLLDAENLGETQFTAFCKDNLLSEKPDIFTIKKNQLKTFSNKTKKMTSNKGRTIAVKSTRDLFARLLVISKTREIDLKGLLSYSLNEFPLSIATVSGDLVKTTKSKMFEILEKMANSPIVHVESFYDGTALVVDAMAIVQAMKGKWGTFGEFSVFHPVESCEAMEGCAPRLCGRQVPPIKYQEHREQPKVYRESTFTVKISKSQSSGKST